MKNPFKKLFWFLSPQKFNPKQDKDLLIHQTLSYGSLSDVKKLFKLYSKKEIKKTFIKGKKGAYDPRAVAWLKIILGIKHLNKNNYVKKIHQS